MSESALPERRVSTLGAAVAPIRLRRRRMNDGRARLVLPRGQRRLARAALDHPASAGEPARAPGQAWLSGGDISPVDPGPSGTEDPRGDLRRRLPLRVRAGSPDPLATRAARNRVRPDRVRRAGPDCL